MIEINLLEVKKPFKMPEILGIDLNNLNIKFLVLAYIFTFVPDMIFTDVWQEEVNELDSRIARNNKKLNELNREIANQKDIEAQIQAFVQQEKKLGNRLEVVKKIIKLKKNPMNIMLYLTKNIPKDVWLKSFKIENLTLIVTGDSSSYKSIGIFIENLRSSVFFDSTLHLKNSFTKEGKNKIRTESFEIEGSIRRFD
jgi:Tfp pilus assembly protein PilN